MMQFKRLPNAINEDLISVFKTSFIASEGAGEGALIAELVRTLLSSTPPDDLRVFGAHQDDRLVGAILLSRMRYDRDDADVFLLSPVAVDPNYQRQGIGQAVITYGLDMLRADAVSAVLTYGNPNYYAKTGFQQISTKDAASPFPLSMPIGWLGQSLTGATFRPLQGTPTCAAAFANADLW